jgi:hypothetical protein
VAEAERNRSDIRVSSRTDPPPHEPSAVPGSLIRIHAAEQHFAAWRDGAALGGTRDSGTESDATAAPHRKRVRIRHASGERHLAAHSVDWRAGLRIQEALALVEADLD